ncbi:MAG: hypothetical protein RL762_1641 [Bacteroidota bacterium]|jgi:hypothetical protein
MKKTFFLSFIVFNFIVNAQSNPRSTYKNGVGIQLGGPTTIISINYNHFWTANINGEAGIGLLGAYTGAKYYFGKEYNRQIAAPYVGATFSLIPPFFSKGYQRIIYLPIGLQLMSKKGYNLSLEVASCFIKNYGEIPGLMYDFSFFGGIKIGKNFK